MYRIFINKEEVVCDSNITIEEELKNSSSIELYKVYPKSWKGTNKLLTDYYYPSDYSECKIYKNNNLYFCGFIKNSDAMSVNPFRPHYCNLQILDYTALLSEGNTLDFVITEKTITEAIEMVIDSISEYGFVVGNIEISDNSIIGAYSTLDKTPYDVFNYLENISGSRWKTRMVDENTTAIDFYDKELLSVVGTIENNALFFKQNQIQDINYSYSTNNYRNRQTINSDKVYGNLIQQERKITDGYSEQFITEQSIGKIIKIVINDYEKAVATQNEKEAGIIADFYYTPGEKIFISNNKIISNQEIIISYIPIIKGRQIMINNSEIDRITKTLSRNGIISRYENRNDILKVNELNKIAESYIKYKGIPEIEITIQARKDFLNLGEKYKYNALIGNLTGEYLVKSKTTKLLQNGNFYEEIYKYVLTNSFDTDNEINYFDNQRNKENGNISEGEYITRNIDIENTANIIFKNLEIEQIGLSGINELNAILEAPFRK